MRASNRHLFWNGAIVFLAIGAVRASVAADDARTLLVCRFDGQTGHGGMDADVAAGNAVAVSVVGCTLVPGREGQAVQIGSAGNRGELGYSAAGNLDPLRGTIEFWIRLNWDCTQDTSRRARVWFDVGTGGNRDRLYLHSRDRDLRLVLCDGGGAEHAVRSRSFPKWKPGEWHHVACTWDVSHASLTLWIDHVLEGDEPSNPAPSRWPLDPSPFTTLRIGSFGNIDAPFDGVMDDLRISNVGRYVRQPEMVSREQVVDLERRQAAGKQALALLIDRIDSARKEGIDTSYFEAVEMAAETGAWRMGQSRPRPSLKEMLSYCDYLTMRCTQAAAALTAVIEGQQRALKVPRPSVLNLRIVGDTFQDEQGNSVLLVGIRNITFDELGQMSRFFNLNTWSWQSQEQIAAEKQHNVCGQVHLLWSGAVAEALKSRPDMRNVDGYSGGNWGEGICVESPTTRQVIAEAIAKLPIMQREEDPSALYALLSAEDRYLCYCPRSIELFQEWLQAQYHDPRVLSALWAAPYDEFGAVRPPRLEQGALIPDNRGAWYDWLRFNRDRVTDFYVWLSAQVRPAWPRTPLNAGTNLLLGDSRFGAGGVDPEALNERVNDVLQCETVYNLPTPPAARQLPPYGTDVFGETSLDFQRSTCDKPATDLEFHAWMRYAPHLRTLGQTLPPNYVSAAIYRHFLHGIRAADIWVWNRKPETAGDLTAFGCSPAIPLESVEECLRAALDVRRLAREITALTHLRPQVAILFSDSTFLQIPPSFIAAWAVPTPCTVELNNVYHGSLFLDTPIGVVTERSIVRGSLKPYRVVLVPAVSHIPPQVFEALMAYVEGGGVLVVTPRSFLFDPYNRPQPYLRGIVDIDKTVIHGLLPGSSPAAWNDPTFLERQVVDPGDARIPGTAMETTGQGVFKGKTLHLEGTGIVQTLTAPTGEPLASFVDGTPAIVVLGRGQGRIYYCAMPLKPQSYATLLDAVLPDAGVERLIRIQDARGGNAWGVEARACEDEGDILLYAINLLSVPVDVRLVAPRPIQAVHDLISDQALGERLRLTALQTVILRVKIETPGR
jgi:hypothetical protein